ncbi:F0F1 ATP synthase subunit B family protein [Labrys monachus]|uniref:ATP synthase subunit b n=1 Tax=Labrys monachus TaxID=217067 RepID=A0ABU0FAK0_9HYPH|nr:ATP F0F1 synthase subunit B [Labrys monachus]MDQ0391642.1 F-type H+-transporting ATPase subunit b [Labrys monachus]
MYFAEMLHEVFDPAGPEFYILLAVVIFLLVIWKVGGFAQIGKALDARGNAVRMELDQARSLREEAQRLLTDYQRRQKEAEAEAASMIETARIDAERFKAEQIAKIEDFVARRTKLADQKIAQAEATAIAEVRAAAADAAVKAASSILSDQPASSAANLMSAALNEVRAKLN